MKRVKRKPDAFLTDYLKAVKKIMRETVGLQPTRVKQSIKIYNRSKEKRNTKKFLEEN